MNKSGFIMPIIIAATLGAIALYFSSENNTNTSSETNKVNEYEMATINPSNPNVYNPSDPNLYNSSSGDVAIGGFKTKRHKNKHMKKKSRRSRKSKK